MVKYLVAALACALTAVIATPLRHYLDLANIVMLFLLAVLLVALRLGRGPAVLAAFFSVALFDFFFVPPRLSFAVNDVQYLLTFAVMLPVALTTGQLTAGLRHQADLASIKEARTRALYELARELAGALTLGRVVEVARKFVGDVMRSEACVLIPDRDGRLRSAESDECALPAWVQLFAADTAYNVGVSADLDASQPCNYFRLRASTRARGVLAVKSPDSHIATLSEHHELLKAVASLVAIAIERLHYVEVANDTQIQMASERLRSSILASLSHDLRTPLTALVGLADSLAMAKPPLPPEQQDTAGALRDQAMRLSGLVVNLLDMTRLSAGVVKLRKEWQPLEEVVGSSIKLLEPTLAGRQGSINLSPNLPFQKCGVHNIKWH